MHDEWTWTVGHVVSLFGIRGELKIRIETDSPERFTTMKQVCLRRKSGVAQLFDVESGRLHKGQALLKLKGINSIEDAQLWRGTTVQVTRDQATPLDEGDYYVSDLIGIEVSTVSGKLIGKIEEVLPYPGHDLYKIGDVLIPAVRPIIANVDLTARTMLVDPPEGMLPGDDAETEE